MLCTESEFNTGATKEGNHYREFVRSNSSHNRGKTAYPFQVEEDETQKSDGGYLMVTGYSRSSEQNGG